MKQALVGIVLLIVFSTGTTQARDRLRDLTILEISEELLAVDSLLSIIDSINTSLVEGIKVHMESNPQSATVTAETIGELNRYIRDVTSLSMSLVFRRNIPIEKSRRLEMSLLEHLYMQIELQWGIVQGEAKRVRLNIDAASELIESKHLRTGVLQDGAIFEEVDKILTDLMKPHGWLNGK